MKSSDGVPCLPFCNVPTVVISRVKSQFADSVFVYRQSVEILEIEIVEIEIELTVFPCLEQGTSRSR